MAGKRSPACANANCKISALSKRIAEIRSQQDQKHDDHLMQCRQEFGEVEWPCPGGGWGR